MGIKDNGFFKESTIAAVILIIALTFAAYANSLGNSFAGDDFSIIVNNDFVKSWKNFSAVFSRSYLDSTLGKKYSDRADISSGEKTYRPVVTISYFIDYSLWKLNPFGYHLSNLILHIFNVILLYFLVGLITKDKKIALLSSLFFGLHPINSEVVNAIAFREDLLAFLFFMASFILFVKSDYYTRRRRLYCYLASVLLFLLALFSKEMAITLPVLLMLYDYYFVFQGKPKKIFTNFKSRYLSYILISLLYLWLRFFLMRNMDETLIKYPGGNFYVNLFTMPKVFVTYIRWLLFPVDVHVTLRDPSFFSYSFFKPEVLFSISTFIVCLVLAIALYRRAKLISFAIFWFFIGLLPVSNILPLSNIMACRYLYISAAGFCFLIAILLHKLPALRISFIPGHILQRAAKDAIVVLVIFYSVFTIMKGLTWRNDIALWSEAVEYYPDNAFAHRGLGDCFRRNGLVDKAISEYETAIGLDPYHTKTCNILGVYYGQKNQYKKSLVYLKQAIKLEPMCTEAYNNLGVTYANMKNYDEARKVWKKALEIGPEFKEAKDNLKKLERLKIGGELINYVQNSNDKK